MRGYSVLHARLLEWDRMHEIVTFDMKNIGSVGGFLAVAEVKG